MPQQGDHAVLACATDEDDAAAQRRLQIEVPSGRKAVPGGWRALLLGRALAARGDKPHGALTKVGERGVVEAAPHFLLPAAVEILGRVLQARLPGRREDRDNAEAQA